MPDYSVAIVKQLNNGVFVSGSRLAKQLNISRSRVWQIIQKLQASGLSIDAVSGKGYLLTQTIELLNQQSIQQYLKPSNNINITVFSHINSTNDYLIKHHKKHPAPAVVLAESQSAGRGRRGKSWMGSFASGLALSFYHQFNIANNQLSGLSLVAGLAVVKALQHINIYAQLKWPNDIYVNNKKLAGLLIDIVPSSKSQSKVITGIGLNIKLPTHISEQIAQPVIDIASIQSQATISRNQISALIIQSIEYYYHQFSQNGLKPLLKQWQQYDCLLNKPIKIEQQNETTLGIAKGVNEHGALKVSINGQISTLYSGEVSLKLL